MAETHPDFKKHIEQREGRIATSTSQVGEGEFEYPPARAGSSAEPPTYVREPGSRGELENDRHYGAYPSAAEVVRAWRERNANLSGEEGRSAGSGSDDNGRSHSASRERRRRKKRQERSHTEPTPRSHFGAPPAPGTFTSWFGHSSRDYADNSYRSHHSVRNSVRDLVRSAVTSDNPVRSAVVQDVLEGCKENCREAGVTFGEVLAEDMEGLGVPPLVYEIFSCWEDPALLQFLLENTPARHVERFVRKGCMMRGDNNMFQALRSTLAANETVEIVPYDLTLKEEDGRFHITGSIDRMPELLSRVRTPANERKRPLPSMVEWIAAGRLWSIEPTSHESIILRLVDGDPLQLTDADLTIVARDAASSSGRKNSMAVSMMKDKTLPVTLVPLSQSGTNNVLFIPFSPMEERLTLPACLSADGALHFQLTLSFATRSASPESEDEDWERIAREEEWVLASYAGKDGETHV